MTIIFAKTNPSLTCLCGERVRPVRVRLTPQRVPVAITFVERDLALAGRHIVVAKVDRHRQSIVHVLENLIQMSAEGVAYSAHDLTRGIINHGV